MTALRPALPREEGQDDSPQAQITQRQAHTEIRKASLLWARGIHSLFVHKAARRDVERDGVTPMCLKLSFYKRKYEQEERCEISKSLGADGF